MTLNICSVSPVSNKTLYQIWVKSSNRRSYCSLNVWPYDLERVLRVKLCCGIIFTKLKLSSPIRSWNITIFPLSHAVTLISGPLTLNFDSTSSDPCLNSVQNWAKANNPRLSYWRYSTLPPSNFRVWGIFCGRFTGVRGPNFIKLWEDICFRVQISRFVSKCRRLKCKWCRSWNSNFACTNRVLGAILVLIGSKFQQLRYLRSSVSHHRATFHGNLPTYTAELLTI